MVNAASSNPIAESSLGSGLPRLPAGAGWPLWTQALPSETWQGGIVAGYLWRSKVLGAGVEADYVARDLREFAIDDGIASLRGRLGLFVAPGTFLYGSAGVGEATGDVVPDRFSKGLVVGGGIEKDVANLAVRAEVLHYRHAEDYLE